MATKLEKLKITKVDFVDNGANPEANVMIFKSEDPPGELETETELSLIDKAFMNLSELINKAFGKKSKKSDLKDDEPDQELEEPEIDVEDDEDLKEPGGIKKADEITVSKNDIIKSIRFNGYGMSESMVTIMNDDDIDVKKAALLDNLQDYYDITAQAIECWAEGKIHTDIAKGLEEINPDYQDVFKSVRDWLDEQIEKSNNKKNIEVEEESMDLSKMSKEDRSAYDALVAKYDAKKDPEKEEKDPAVDEKKDGGKGTFPFNTKKDVKKSMEDIYKGLPTEVVEELTYLRKRADAADDKELMDVAKNYEMIGKKADELFPVLKSLKAADETAYKNMIDVLNSSKTAIEKSGLFDEIGKSGHGAQNEMTAINKKADEIMEKDPNLNRFQAIDKVFETNPELRQEYDV